MSNSYTAIINSMPVLCFIYIFILGLCIGSFLNVVILRGLIGENIVIARSKCPKCNKALKWYMNIPLISYIFLMGKCGFCKEPISFQYPLIEFISACCFVFSFFTFGLTLKALFVCAFLSLFIVMSATDFKETVIIDLHAYILVGLGIIYSILHLGDINILQSVLGSVFGFFTFEILARSGYIFVKQRAFGEGDSLIAAGLGAIFGIKTLFLIIAISFLIQSFSAIPILINNAIKENKKKLAISYSLTILSIIALFLNSYYDLIKNHSVYSVFAITIGFILLLSLKEIIYEIKNKQENQNNLCIMPFGPALLISGALCLFFLNQIKSIVIKLCL